ncbi:MAG: lamin tail domain-containing protein [Verrucomicrobiota bacterium]
MFGPNGIWSNTSAEGEAWERACAIEYPRPDGEKGFHLNCGIRLQGGFSRFNTPKHGLRLLFKSTYGPSKLDYNLYPDSAVQEFDTLVLHGAYNDHWINGNQGTVMHRDQWCRDTQNAMGGYGPHGRYVHLYLNGIYWGVYNIGEKGDASYAAHFMGGDKSEYDALNSDELIDGTIDAWNAMLALANTSITTDAAYTNLSQYLNIPSFIDYMMLNFYAANTDWPGHNWNAARRRVPGATFQFFSWDAEWTFGLYLGGTDDRTGVSDGSPGKLYNALRGHPEFRREFGDRVQKACFNGGVLTPTPALARWTERFTELDRAMVGETARWGSSREAWLSSDNAVQNWFTARHTVLVNQLRNAGLYPSINAPTLTPFGGLIPTGAALTLSNPNGAGTIYYTLDGSDPRLWGGGLNAAAKIYSSPITATNAGILHARILNGSTWSALVEAPFYILQNFSGLAVTEIMYHPPALGTNDGDELEFLELKNTGTNTLDLAGLQFDSGITFAFTNGTQLAPNQFAVLVRNPALFATRYPGVAIKGVYTGKLDNAGEKLTLAHVLGTNILSFSYSTTSPWPITPDGYGFSLVRANSVSDPSLAFSWRASANQLGSPGADDPAVSLPGVVINEILTHTDLPQVDSIELFNPTAALVNVGGWFLSDDPKQPKKFRITTGTTIPANGFIVFTETNFNAMPGSSNSFRLSSYGESLFLFSGDNSTNLTGYSHSLDYGAAANGVSFGRHLVSTGEEFWPAQAALTLGATNSVPRLGPIVINEIQYHAPAGYDEFVELYNLSATNVPLYHVAFPTNTWRLNGLDFNFPTNFSLGAGNYLLVVPIDPPTFRTKYSVPVGITILGPIPAHCRTAANASVSNARTTLTPTACHTSS